MTDLLDDLAEFAQLQKERESMEYGPDRAHAYDASLSKAFHLLEEHAAEIERNARDAELGRIVWKFIDRMNDLVPEDNAEKVLGEFVKACDPVIRASIDAMRGGGE